MEGNRHSSILRAPRAPARASLAVLAALLVGLLGAPQAAAEDVTWTRVGLTGAAGVQSFAVSRANSDLMLVSAWTYDQGAGVLCRSADGGRTWTQVFLWNSGSPPASVTLHPRDHNVAYLMVEQGGDAWWLRGKRVPSLCGSEARVRGTLERSTGLFRTSDFGATWKRVLAGQVYRFAVDPSDSRVLLALKLDLGDEKGTATEHVFRSGDGGKTWTKSGRIGRIGGGSSLTFDPQDSRIVYLTAEDGLYRSTNGGRTFSRVLDGRTERVLVPSANPSVVYARGSDPAYSGQRPAYYASADRGVTWRRFSLEVSTSDILWDIAVNPGDPSVLLGLICAFPDPTRGQARLLRSSDRGASWSDAASPGLTTDSCFFPPVHNRSGSVVYLPVPGAVLRSDDMGATWTKVLSTPIDAENQPLPQVTVSPEDSNSVVVTDYRQNIYFSTDAGRSFAVFDTLVNQRDVVLVDQPSQRALYATTSGNNGGQYGREVIGGLWRYALPKRAPALEASDPISDVRPRLGGLRYYLSLGRP